MQVILLESNFNTHWCNYTFKLHGHFLSSPNLGLQQLFIVITDLKNFSIWNHQDRHWKTDFSNPHKKKTTKELPLSEWSLVVWNHYSCGTDASSVSIILHSAHFIRAFSASLSEALRRSVSECAMRQHAPHLCDRCMKHSAVSYSTSKASICSRHTHSFTHHTDTSHVTSIQNY